ncbi:MAG: ATP phosphoribosyltransferase regulatory subunit [Betaproteobacteria bacterium]|jgi:ATP phosphoribosyltransferase regulatory subunit|nr:ATP phosphoribosyltransferase regulatory subunit [Betaproteobacteria bacterium]MCH9842032.1 ATP phosphoribosyltransferase regulatory subunit [Betaproteobacteria bacterium]
MSQWRLPNNLEDLLPSKAIKLETFRRALIDLFACNGYQYIMPSLLEYEESLKAHGKDLDIDTYKVVDQLSGRMMGISSDLTTQASRVDAYLMQGAEKESKLCYAGPVLRTKSKNGHSRELFQVGLEYFGSAAPAADLEVLTILINSLQLLGIKEITIDLNDLSIFQSIIQHINLNAQEKDDLLQAMILKDKSSASSLLIQLGNNKHADQLLALFNLYGDSSVIKELSALDPSNRVLMDAIKKLDELVLALTNVGAKVTFDFSDITGYQYHSGLVFSAYTDGFTAAIAHGGRYDNLNESLGLKRPATGFSLDLRYLVNNL